MERRQWVRGAGMAGVLLSSAAPAVVRAQPALRWRLASSFPKVLDVIYGAGEVFASKVGELSGGRFQISVHAAGELMPAFGVLDGVQNGTVEMSHTAPYYYFGKDETFALACAIPFGLNSRQTTAWMYQGNGLTLLREFYREYQIYNLPGGNTGTQMGGWFRKPIKSTLDLKGLKFRVGGFPGKVLERLGCVPQSIPAGDIYTALEKGTIDAAEWVGPHEDLRLGLFRVAPFYHYPGWWDGGPQLEFHIHTKAWDALPPEYQAIVTAAANWAHVDMQARSDARNPPALKQLVGQGAKLVRFPRETLSAALKESLDLYSEISARNPRWRKVYEDYALFRREQNLWFRFAETGFDSFMQRRSL